MNRTYLVLAFCAIVLVATCTNARAKERHMKMYQVVNPAFQPVPVPPFQTERDAVSHIKTLQETYDEVFHVIELNITSSVQPPRRDK